MSVEERGKSEDLPQDASSAELPPSDATALTEALDTEAVPETATDVAGAVDEPVAENGANSADATAMPVDEVSPEEPSEEEPTPVETSEPTAEDEPLAETANAVDDHEAAAMPVEEVAPEESSAEEEPTPVETSEPTAEDEPQAEPAKAVEDSEAAALPAEEDLAEEPSEEVTATPAEASEAPAQDEPAVDAATEDADTETAAASTEPVAEADQPADDKSPAAAAESAPAKEDVKYKRGQVYQGVISSTTPTTVFVDLGDGDQGVVPGRELELMTRKMLESLTVGAEVDVYVVNPRNHRGETVLSINHALEELDWRNAEKFSKSKEVYEAQIGGYNKGGLIVRFGRLRGFVPQSQLAEDRVRNMTGDTPEERYGPMVNQPIGVKVMEVDRHRNRLILSERSATREVRQARKEALIADLNIGEIRKGKVVSLESFGAFVDIGGGEGLIHVSELAWGHITHPRQAVSIGDEVEVEVISVNTEAKRIGLSRRRVLRDPWDEIATSLRRGQLVRGRVTKLTKFGAFARLVDHDTVEGLIHISELSGDRVTHPREAVNRGDELVLRIIKIDIKERRLGLSLKSVQSTEYLDLDWEMAIQDSASLPAAEPQAEADAVASEPDVESEAATEE